MVDTRRMVQRLSGDGTLTFQVVEIHTHPWSTAESMAAGMTAERKKKQSLVQRPVKLGAFARGTAAHRLEYPKWLFGRQQSR